MVLYDNMYHIYTTIFIIHTWSIDQHGATHLHLLSWHEWHWCNGRNLVTSAKNASLFGLCSQRVKVCIGSWAADCRTILQNWQDKTPKASPKKRSIVKHSIGLPQDAKSLRSCSGNQAKMLLKGHLWIKCHSENNKVIRLFKYSSANNSKNLYCTVSPIC